MTDPKNLRISATLYTTWKTCPAQAAARLAGHYPADTINSFKGLLAHRIFARHLTQGHIAPSGFRQVCQQEIGSSNLNWKVRELGLKPSQVQATISEVADLYRRFTSAPALYNHRGDRQVELHLEHQVDELTTLVGTIDATFGDPTRITLTDWKTGELGAVTDQLRFYAVLHQLATGHMPMAVEAISIATGERTDEWITPELIATTISEIAECAADLTTPGTVETPGPWCRWCPILEQCTPGQGAVRLLT